MKKRPVTKLGYAILGLIYIEPRTGYALRKVFETTPMGHYSSSPGAIYPALKRLEEMGLARGRILESGEPRPKRIFEMTGPGIETLRKWVKQQVSMDDIIWHMDELMLRFAFMGGLVDSDASYRFLSQMLANIETRVAELEQFLLDMPKEGPPHGRLALVSGLESYKAQARWSRNAMKEFKPVSN